MPKPASVIPLFRNLIKELRLANGNKPVKDSLAYQYIRDQFRQYQVTSQKICKGENEVEHLGKTYLCLLENIRRHEELSEMYKGKGERSVDESARIVGLQRTPKYKPD